MDFRVLGALEVRDDEATVPVRRGIPQLVLIALLLRAGETVTPGWLAEVLWGMDQPRNPSNALQTQVSYLRRVLASGPSRLQPIATRAGGYVLDVSPESVDSTRFLRAVERARRHAELTTVRTLEAAIAQVEEALRLWRGPAFADAGSRHFVVAEATRLEEVRLGAVEARLDWLMALGRHHDVAADLGALVAEHPLRERFHEQLMLALYRAGRQADALRAYEDARVMLRDELGLDPGPSLQHLRSAVLDHAPELDWVPARDDGAGGPAAPRPTEVDADPPAGRSGVPAALTPLIGREHEVARLRHLLARGRLVTVTGPGGAGKTALATEVARRVAAEGAVRFVDLDGVPDDGAVPLVVATALGVPVQLDQDPTDALASALAPATPLLVLDTCEHVIGGAARLATRLLSRCEDVRILATSRRPLGVRGEVAWPVPPLDVPSADAPLEEVAAASSVALFVERATAVRPDFTLDDRNAADIATICAALDGLPLAIELAAARVDALSPGVVLDRLCDRFSLLVDGDRAASARQQTLRATIDWSVALLTPDERRMFVRLSVFAGPFGLDQAVAIAGGDIGDPLGTLAGLVRQSMVVRAADDEYHLLDTPREYARELLAADPERHHVHEQHARIYVELAGAAGEGLWSPRQPEVVALLRTALPNLRAATAWSFDHGQEELAARIAGALAWFFMLNGMTQEGLALLGRADAEGRHLSRYAKSRVAYGIGLLSAPAGRLEAAKAACERSVRLARQGRDDVTTAEALAALSVAEWALGDLAAAAAHQDESIVLYEASTDPWRHADILVLRARTAVDQGDPAAPSLLERALGHARAVGDHHAAGMALSQLSQLAAAGGDHAAAARYAADSLAAHEALAEPEATAGALHLLGRAKQALGEHDDARRLHERALELALAIGHVGAACEAVEDLGALAAAQGRPDDALRLLDAAEAERTARAVPRRAHDERRVAALRAALARQVGTGVVAAIPPFGAVVDQLRARAARAAAPVPAR